MLEIEIVADIKKSVEYISCPMCKRAKLKFYSVEIDDEFDFQDGQSVEVDAYCKACERDCILELNV